MRVVEKGGRGTTVKPWPTISLDTFAVMFQRQVSEVRHYVANMELQVCSTIKLNKHPYPTNMEEVKSHDMFWRPWGKKYCLAWRANQNAFITEDTLLLRSFWWRWNNWRNPWLRVFMLFFFFRLGGKQLKAYLRTIDSSRTRKRHCLGYYVGFRSSH